MNNLAPVLLFVYNRPLLTERCVASLLQSPLAPKSELVIFADGAKGEKDSPEVDAVKAYIRGIKGFKSVEIHENPANTGLAANIIKGVSESVERFGKVIVVEDDLVVSPCFLEFMNKALVLYRDVEEVVNINSHVLEGPQKFPDNFLISFADSWGWATWKRGWDLFEPDGTILLEKIKKMRASKRFDLGYHFVRMLREQIEGKNNSWAIRWNASIFVNGKVSLNAGKPLAVNTGFGKGATHCNTPDLFAVRLYTGNLEPKLITPATEDPEARNSLRLNYIVRTSYANKLRVRVLEFLSRFAK